MKKLFIEADDRDFRAIVESLRKKNQHLEIVYDQRTYSVRDKRDRDFFSEVLETSRQFKGRIFTYINCPYYSVILDGERCDWGTIPVKYPPFHPLSYIFLHSSKSHSNCINKMTDIY